jgi:hypothetical protein
MWHAFPHRTEGDDTAPLPVRKGARVPLLLRQKSAPGPRPGAVAARRISPYHRVSALRPDCTRHEESDMAAATSRNQERIIANQQRILFNQRRLLKILDNEVKIIRNQQAIIRNQKKILANQSRILAK